MRGGEQIGPNTLTRFFVFHIGVLPTAIFLLIGLHIFQIRLHGVSIPEQGPRDVKDPKAPDTPGPAVPEEALAETGDADTSAVLETVVRLEDLDEMRDEDSETFPFFPDHFFTELILGLALTIILTVLALIVPAPLGEPADPNVTPEHIKPEWYFFPMFRWLKLTSFEIGIMGAIVAIGLFILWPFIDRLLERAFPRRQVSTWIGVVVVLTLIVFTVWEALV